MENNDKKEKNMENICFDTGVKEFTINGAAKVSFSPTDMSFIKRMYNCLDNMDKKQEGYKKTAEKITGIDVFNIAEKMDEEARDEINGAFGCDICTPVFGSLNLFAVADGLPVWANFMLAIIDQLDGAFAEEKKKTNPRIAKYTAKYKR